MSTTQNVFQNFLENCSRASEQLRATRDDRAIAASTKRLQKLAIKTAYMHPPIPTRAYDWQAYIDGSIDVCGDAECDCRSKAIIGTGPSEEAAITDLLQQLDIQV